MMESVFPQSGHILALMCLVREPIALRLFANDHWPQDEDSAGSYTEVSGYGYREHTLQGPDWTILLGKPVSAVHGWQTFVFTGPAGRIYGYYLIQAESGILICAERFGESADWIGDLGGQIRVRPMIMAG